jgi:hypothetical protein
MITRAIRPGPPRRINRDERELVDSPGRSHVCFLPSCVPKDMGRRSAVSRDQSSHHAVPTCRRSDLSALGHVGFPTEDDVAEAVCSGLACVLYDPIDGIKRMDQSIMRVERHFLTVQISECLRQHELV